MPEMSLESFRTGTLKGYLDWYWADGTRVQQKYLRTYWLGLLCGLVSTIVAAFPSSIANSITSGGAEFLKWLVVALSAAATVANSTLVPRYKRMLDDRDKGRIRLDALNMKMQLMHYPEETRTILEQAIAEIADVEGGFGSLDKAPERRDAPP